MGSPRLPRFTSNSDWALIPGPMGFTEPLYSTHMVEGIAEYAPGAAAQALREVPGVGLSHAPEPSWWEWRAYWEGRTGLIEFEMSLLEPDQRAPCFGGFGLTADCEPKDLLLIWEALRVKFPGVWLHSPDCEVIKPAALAARYAT